MSVENINNKVDEFYSLNAHDRNVLNELDPLSKDSFKLDENGTINAESIAVKVSKKNTSENSEPHGENSRGASQNQSSEGLAQKQLKKGARVIEFFGSLANGVFGSSKKQEEELRRLEQEVQSLNEQTNGLTSEIKGSMFDSMAIQSGMNIDSDVSRSNHATLENNQIDDRSKLNMKKAEKLHRMSELRKKGVK